MAAEFSTEDLLRVLPRPIAVVGNGPVGPSGAEIDGHASVIRINNFVIEGHEANVGKALTAWCVNCWIDVPWRDLGVFAFTPFHAEDGDRVLEWKREHNILVPETRWSELVRGLKPRKPSTGLLLLFALQTLKVKADAYGFDGLTGGHYWDPTHVHDHPAELEALRSLDRIRLCN